MFTSSGFPIDKTGGPDGRTGIGLDVVVHAAIAAIAIIAQLDLAFIDLQ